MCIRDSDLNGHYALMSREAAKAADKGMVVVLSLIHILTVEGASTAVYNHMNRNGLCTIVAFNKNVDEQLAKIGRAHV